MKKFLFLLLTGWLLALPSLTAQTDMIWEDFGLGFRLPPGMVITENDGETFTAENDDLVLSIVPVKDRSFTEDDLADAVIAMADELEYDEITDAHELELNDLYGFYVEGDKDGVQAVVIALMDTLSANNYLAVIAYTKKARQKAIDLARSFYAFDN